MAVAIFPDGTRANGILISHEAYVASGFERRDYLINKYNLDRFPETNDYPSGFSYVWHMIKGDLQQDEKYIKDIMVKLYDIIDKYDIVISPDIVEDRGRTMSSKKYANNLKPSYWGLGNNPLKTLENNLQGWSGEIQQKANADFQSAQSIKKSIEKIKEIDEKKVATDILMKDPFSIFANGYLYKQGAAGSKSYNPLTPYEPYKYITGDIANNEFDDILMGRSHLKLAGNRDYFSNVWGEAQWNTPNNVRKNKQLERYILGRTARTIKGFKELAAEGFDVKKHYDMKSMTRDEFDRPVFNKYYDDFDESIFNMRKQIKYFKISEYSTGISQKSTKPSLKYHT